MNKAHKHNKEIYWFFPRMIPMCGRWMNGKFINFTWRGVTCKNCLKHKRK
jgi:hypothetical protein